MFLIFRILVAVIMLVYGLMLCFNPVGVMKKRIDALGEDAQRMTEDQMRRNGAIAGLICLGFALVIGVRVYLEFFAN